MNQRNTPLRKSSELKPLTKQALRSLKFDPAKLAKVRLGECLNVQGPVCLLCWWYFDAAKATGKPSLPQSPGK